MAKPPSRFERLRRLGSLTGKVGANYLGQRVRGFLRGRPASEDDLDEVHIRSARDFADALSELKGAAMKFGQGVAMAAQQLDLPPEVSESLAKLHKDSDPIPFEDIRASIERELEMPLAEAFAAFDEAPLGTASLAQAHVARLHSGEEVVVKVLHDGIDDSVATDLATLKALLLSSRLVRRDRREVDNAFAEIQERLEEELDYLQEAANIALFHEQWKDDPRVRVPQVHGSRSTQRVLTMTRMPGVGVEEFAATASAEARQRAGETLAELYFTMAFDNLTLHADPHPGNYLFEPDGRVGLLDFGCVKRFDEFFIGTYCRVAIAALDGDREAAVAAARDLGALANRSTSTEDTLWNFLDALATYLRRPTLTVGGPDDTIIEELRPYGRAVAMDNDLRVPRDIIFLHRSMGGIYAIAKRIGCTVDAGARFRAHAERAVARAEGRAV